jgi:hypothetical protein
LVGSLVDDVTSAGGSGDDRRPAGLVLVTAALPGSLVVDGGDSDFAGSLIAGRGEVVKI